MAEATDRVLVGKQLGAYKITALLGAGGMGEVYRAEDTRLGRAVAVKVLPEELAQDKDRLHRFAREARAASALNHANVAHIYEIGQSDGIHFIAMEYVEGQSLTQKMRGQPLDLSEILEIGIQASDALENAHRKGITHRDIKSANLMISPRGQVKVLDFGLAKITRPEGAAVGSDVSTSIRTTEGRVVGTLGYMSPEQVLGKELDARTDLFSLGVVLYEMTTGRLPFSGSPANEVIDRILHAQPEALARFNYEVPVELERIVRKCLEKDRERRYQLAREVWADLSRLKEGSAANTVMMDKSGAKPRERLAGRPATALSVSRKPVFALCAAVFVGGALAASLIWALTHWMAPAVEVSLLARASIRQISSYTATERDPAISPDGRYFAFVSNRGGQPNIWVRQISGGDPVQLTRDEAPQANLVYAPDGESIYYNTPVAIFRVGALSGTPQKVVEGGREPSLSADGSRLAYLRDGSIYIAARDGTGEKKVHDARGWQAHMSLSPDGRRVAFTEGGLFEMLYLYVVGTDGRSPRRLTEVGFGSTPAPAWLPDGQALVFERSTDRHPRGRASDLWIMPAEGGSARRLTMNPSGRFGSLSISGNGRRLVATLLDLQTEVWRAPLGPDPEANGKAAQRLLDNSDGPMWTHTSGTTLLFSGWLTGVRNLWAMPLDGGPARQVTSLEANNSVTHAALSPDGTRVAFTSLQTGNAEIWTMNMDGSNPVQLTRRASPEYWPAWTNDGKWIAFGSEGAGPPQIWKMPSHGGEPVQLTRNGGIRGDWSPVDNRIVYSAGGHVGFPFAKPRLEVADFDGKVLLSVDWPNAGNTLPVWSPDGRRFSAIQNESLDSNSVWVFDANTGKGKAAVKFPGRFHMIFRACWTPDGKSIIVDRIERLSHIVLLEDFWL